MSKQMVLIENGVSLDVAEFADDQVDFRGWVDYDPAVHDPVHYPSTRIKGDFLNKDIFLFELFTEQEQVVLATQINRVPSQANWDSDTPNLIEAAYRVLYVAEKQLENVEHVQLSSGRTERFLNLCATLQVFGPDAATQLRRITMIKYGIKP